jgi:hypothetical protein
MVGIGQIVRASDLDWTIVRSDHFRTGRYRNPAIARRQLLAERRRTWREVVGLAPVR